MYSMRMKTINLILLISSIIISSGIAFCNDFNSHDAVSASEGVYDSYGSTYIRSTPPPEEAIQPIDLTKVKGVVPGYPASGASSNPLASYFAKKNKKLSCSGAAGESSPYSTICLDDAVLWKQLNAESDTYHYTIEAIKKNGIKQCSVSRYLIIPDTSIENKSYNTVYLNLPEFSGKKVLNVKFTQVSYKYAFNDRTPELNTRVYYDSAVSGITELPMTLTMMNSREGLLQKIGQLKEVNNKTIMIATSYDSLTGASPSQVYAILVEVFVK